MTTFVKSVKNDDSMKVILLLGLYLYKAKGFCQVFLIFVTACAAVPLLETIKKFMIPNSFDNWVVFLILLILDVMSGLYRHSGKWKKGQPNTLDKDEFFYKLFRKVIAGVLWLILVNVVINLERTSVYFDTFGICTLISWLGWSIASNIYVFTGSTFPPKWIMNKLRNANEGENKPH